MKEPSVCTIGLRACLCSEFTRPKPSRREPEERIYGHPMTEFTHAVSLRLMIYFGHDSAHCVVSPLILLVLLRLYDSLCVEYMTCVWANWQEV